MVDISRRELLKASASIPLLPLLNTTKQEEIVVYEKCYKIVKSDFTSIASFHKYGLEYEINKWIKPKIGKIFVFSSLLDTKYFIICNEMMCQNTMIFKCDAKNLTKAILRVFAPTSNTVAKFWELSNFDHSEFSTLAFRGTMFCDAVKLIERIEYEI